MSEDGETWTVIVTTPDKIACLVASGEGWRQIKPPPSRDES